MALIPQIFSSVMEVVICFLATICKRKWLEDGD
jgi:hypothetical protein